MGFFSFSDFIVDVGVLKNNIRRIKDGLTPKTKFCAVIKADAYGIGAKQIAGAINDSIDMFAVANLEEGIELRNSGVNKGIITLGSVNLEYINLYSEKFLTPPVSTVLEMSKLSSEIKQPISVNFALNTGMNRIGFSSKSEIFSALSLKNKNNKINIWGAFSHLATKENDIKFMYRQKRNFDDMITCFAGKKIVRHLSNTNASLYHQDFNYDMVRVGFGLWGMTDDMKLSPVLSIISRVVHINYIGQNQSVGYDRTFISARPTKIAVVPLGYFDGINRRLSGLGRVIINGKSAKIVGRVCMDAFMVDVTEIENVEIGTRVTILGKDGDQIITITEYASIIGTSPYEVLTGFRYKRMNYITKNY